jgi:hypothetical protein
MSSAFFSQKTRWDDGFAPSRGVAGVSTVLIHRRDSVVGSQGGKPRRIRTTAYETRRRDRITETFYETIRRPI